MSNEKQSSMLDAMLKQYAEATAPKQKQGTIFNKKNYFSIYMGEDVQNLIKRVRILPTNDGSSPFISVHLHSAEVDGQKRKFTCLQKQYGEQCPFCEARMQLLATGEESNKVLARAYSEREYYVLKVIDRDNEADGPKFWRFASNYKKDGIYDKILALIRMLHTDVADAETGRDIVLNIDLVPGMGGRKPYPAITSVMCDEPSKLSTDPEQATAWIEDEKAWTDVYAAKKPYEYLHIIVDGKTPVFNKVLDRFVAKDSAEDPGNQNTPVTGELDSEIEIGGKKTAPSTETSTTTDNTYVADVDKVDEEVDDLPF